MGQNIGCGDFPGEATPTNSDKASGFVAESIAKRGEEAPATASPA
jgi:hypothetical protein